MLGAKRRSACIGLIVLSACGGAGLERIRADGDGFVRGGQRFVARGFNYDHDAAGRLLEDYWQDEWGRVVEDFAEMRALGATVVRIHLQLGRFMAAPDRADAEALRRLARLVALAEETGLHLDVTGLGCYHAADVPGWYDAAGEAERWAVQARFWSAVAAVCAGSPAVFCYDLMNEPILPGAGRVETEWLAGEFGGKHFVQRIALDLAGRTREAVAEAWVARLVAAVRAHDADTPITVGVIPWALAFPGAKPIFYAPRVAAHLDFVSVHFYPERGRVDEALRALAVYELGKPLVVEELFPLRCSADELESFIARAPHVDGWLSFYWGRSAAEYAADGDLRGAIVGDWLRRFPK